MEIMSEFPPITEEEMENGSLGGLPEIPRLCGGGEGEDNGELCGMDMATDDNLFLQPFRGTPEKEVALGVSIIGAMFNPSSGGGGDVIDRVQNAIYACEDATGPMPTGPEAAATYGRLEHVVTYDSTEGSIAQVLGRFAMAAAGGPAGVFLYFPEKKTGLVLVGAENNQMSLIDPHDDPSVTGELRPSGVFLHNAGYFDVQDYLQQHYFCGGDEKVQFVADLFVPNDKGKEEEQPVASVLVVTPEPKALTPNLDIGKLAIEDYPPVEEVSEEGKRKRQPATSSIPVAMKMESEESDEKRPRSPAKSKETTRRKSTTTAPVAKKATATATVAKKVVAPPVVKDAA